MTERLSYTQANEQISELVIYRLRLLEKIRQVDDQIDNLRGSRPLLVSLLKITWVDGDDDGSDAA